MSHENESGDEQWPTSITDDEKADWVQEILDFFTSQSEVYSSRAGYGVDLVPNASDVAFALVDDRVSVAELTAMILSPNASPHLDAYFEKRDLPRLIRAVEMSRGKKRDRDVNANTFNPKRLCKEKTFGDYDAVSLTNHPFLHRFRRWHEQECSSWRLKSTKKAFRRAIGLTAPHALALLNSNRNANLRSLFSHAYLASLCGLTTDLFKYGNAGLVLIYLDVPAFDEIADKYIAKAGKLKTHRAEMNKEWKAAALKEIQSRKKNDKAVKFMLHWSSDFFEANKILDKFDLID